MTLRIKAVDHVTTQRGKNSLSLRMSWTGEEFTILNNIVICFRDFKLSKNNIVTCFGDFKLSENNIVTCLRGSKLSKEPRDLLHVTVCCHKERRVVGQDRSDAPHGSHVVCVIEHSMREVPSVDPIGPSHMHADAVFGGAFESRHVAAQVGNCPLAQPRPKNRKIIMKKCLLGSFI